MSDDATTTDAGARPTQTDGSVDPSPVADTDLLGVPAGLPHRATLAGVGYALPRTVYDNETVARMIKVGPGWIEKRTGVDERRWADQDESVLTLAKEASEKAMEAAGMTAADIDHVIVATYTFDRITPNAAPFLTLALGID
ncbi:MAG: hypothetical protein Q7T55_05320, partial [Solirubrobacteraceae bacterium]|nr:hypothetical protein [Solirubrobacteraceae bacterium]